MPASKASHIKSASDKEGRAARPGGRPCKLTPQVEARLMDAIRSGHQRDTAARLAGISPATLFRYLSDDAPRFRRLQAAIEAAEADLEAELLAVVMSQVPRDPRLALTMLARRFPTRWAASRETQVLRERTPEPAPQPAMSVLVVDPATIEEMGRQRLAEHRRGLGSGEGLPTDLRLVGHTAGDAEPKDEDVA
jgi:AcrR family transcriptional regulator